MLTELREVLLSIPLSNMRDQAIYLSTVFMSLPTLKDFTGTTCQRFRQT